MARYVRISSVSFPGAKDADACLSEALSAIDRAAMQKPDIICMPEVFHILGYGPPIESWPETAQRVPGPIADALAERAKRHKCYVVCPIFERRGKSVYNSAILFDRKGDLVGRYHKMFPTIGEIEGGIRPGKKAPVFETDFGRVGFAICFDLNFHEVRGQLIAGGVELIVFCSMFRGGALLKQWAMDCRCHVVSSTPTENSMIYNPIGQPVAESFVYSRIITKTVNLDAAVLHLDTNHLQFDAIAAKYGAQVEIDVIAPEGIFLLTCHHPRKTADQIVREFKMETLDDYFGRARKVRNKAVGG